MKTSQENAKPRTMNTSKRIRKRAKKSAKRTGRAKANGAKPGSGSRAKRGGSKRGRGRSRKKQDLLQGTTATKQVVS